MNLHPTIAPTPFEYFTVVGVGRSGTSLLMTMLDSHPELALPPETQFVYRHVIAAPQATAEEARRRLDGETNFGRLDFDLDEFFAPFKERGVGYSNASAYVRLLSLWAKKTACDKVGDKSPKNVECLPTIHRMLPAARVIHIIRDPRDVYLSRSKAAWSANRSPWLQTLAYRAQHDTGRRLGPQLFGDRYLEVRYEQLVSEPETALRRICNLLEVEYDPAMLRRQQSAATHVFPEEMDWKREVLGPLLTQNTEKWRHELSPALVRFIEDCCETAFTEEGYRAAAPDSLGQGGLRGAATRRAMQNLSGLYCRMLDRKNRVAMHAIRDTNTPLAEAA